VNRNISKAGSNFSRLQSKSAASPRSEEPSTEASILGSQSSWATQDSITTQLQRQYRHEPVSRRRRPAPAPARTPAMARAALAKSPGGGDYIVTPGRHRINIHEFETSFDKRCGKDLAGRVDYPEALYLSWCKTEDQLPSDVFHLSYPESTAVETIRQMAIQIIFNYSSQEKLLDKTLHAAVLNFHRILHREVELGNDLSETSFGCMVVAAIRNAVKLEETIDKADLFRMDPDHVWKSSSFTSGMKLDRSVDEINRLERRFLCLVEYPHNPPVAIDYLERFLDVGGWPEPEKYKGLAVFLLGLAQFARGSNPLRGVATRKVAAAALGLAIKVINTDANETSYQYWPERLEMYTGMSFEALSAPIRGISMLLRSPPENNQILGTLYPEWGTCQWN